MGSPYVSNRYGFGRDEWIRDMNKERQVREAKAEKPAAIQAEPARDTLELSSRQPKQLGPVQFAPISVPIFVIGLDYTA